VIEAEINIFKYQKEMVLGAKNIIIDHQKLLNEYKGRVTSNMIQLDKYKEANV
jgi:hypothetical protein